MQTAAVPLLVIAPNYPRFERWRRDHGLPSRLVSFVNQEHGLRGIFDRHVVVIDEYDCPLQLLQLARHLAATHRLTVHYSTTADRPELSGEELRARYGSQSEMLPDAAPILHLLGRKDTESRWAVAFRYETLEALEAFGVGNQQHFGYESFGPVIGPDGLIYGVTVLDPPNCRAGGKHDDAAAANTR
jgi:hypothetical protein